MKRYNNLFDKICSFDNLLLAEKLASKGKKKQVGVIEWNKNREENLILLQQELISGTYITSEYSIFKIYEPKEREIYRLPFKDRIVHHAIMNILEPIWVPLFTKDTYSCIKGRGIHSASKIVKEYLKDKEGTIYCLKLDIKKFYPSVEHDILKQIIRRKIKDKRLLILLDGIIESAEGLPIGNYLSQYLANLYLTYFDHWIKEYLKIKYFLRYCDDIVILSNNKQHLHNYLYEIRKYLSDNLNLSIKSNYQIFPVESRSIDFVGYRFYHTHTLLRKSIKKSFARALSKRKSHQSISAYLGWCKHANCINLVNTLTNKYEKVQRIKYQNTKQFI